MKKWEKNQSDESNVFLLMRLYMFLGRRGGFRKMQESIIIIIYKYIQIANAEDAGTLTFLNLIFFFGQVLECRLAHLNLKLKRIAWDIANVIAYPNFIVPRGQFL